jgi:2'-5' RNA ligase
MRTFISLNLSDDTVLILKDFQKSVKDLLGFTESKKVKWEAPDKFHITLFFVGDIDEDKIEQVKEDLKKINTRTFYLRLNKLNAFPNLRNPRVLFTEVVEKGDKLNSLSEAINGIMKGYGYEQGGKFHPHVTLGRVRRDMRLHGLKENAVPVVSDFEISELHIMKSVLSREGSVHESIFCMRLQRE